MAGPRDLVEDIRNRHLSSDAEFTLDSLAGAIDRIQKAFPRYGSFLMEFVQNADDAESQSLRIEISGGAIRILNDGLPFSDEDVRSICKVGRSSKAQEGYIGYLGVGFKAVFLISNHVRIHSAGYHFKFDEGEWQYPERTPWQVIPVWIDSPPVELAGEYRTLFDVQLEEAELVEKLREEVRAEHLSSRILLFLRYIKRIQVIDRTQNLERIIQKSEIAKTSDYETYLIQEWENDTSLSEDHWLVFRAPCDVPPEVREDYTTRVWERESVEQREVLVAYRLDDECNLVKEKKGTAHTGVFSFIPLKEVPSGLNFLLQADFLTTPGRAEFARECLWNNWLADESYALIAAKCIPTFLHHQKWGMNFTDILYSSEGGHELLEKRIKTPVNRYMESNSVLIAEDGSVAKAEELISVGGDIRELIADEDLDLLYPSKRIIHEECIPAPSLRSKVKKVPEDIYDFTASSESEELIRSRARKKSIEWFKKLYSMFVDTYTHDYFYSRYPRYNVAHDDFWNTMCHLARPMILTNDYNVARIDESYLNPKKFKIPRRLKDRFKIVHPQIEKDEKFKRFRRKVNHERYHYPPPYRKVITELAEEDIRQALIQEQVLQLTEEQWGRLSDKERVEQIRELRNLYHDWSYAISIERYPFITLKSKSGSWEKPENLVFPTEYNPEHNLEALVEKGLIDERLEFASPEFIENEYEYEINNWRRFFQELGVDRILDTRKKAIVERIGILAALQCEERNGREARELGESEKRGYDIHSKSRNEERYIEVKSTSQLSSYDMFLTTNEFTALRENKDKYFVYMVLDALGKPRVCVCKGADLLGIRDTKVIIDSGKWEELVHEECEL